MSRIASQHFPGKYFPWSDSGANAWDETQLSQTGGNISLGTDTIFANDLISRYGRPGGDKLWLAYDTGGTEACREYDVSVAWDFDSGVSQVGGAVVIVPDNMGGIWWSPGGTHFYASYLDQVADRGKVRWWTPSNKWDIQNLGSVLHTLTSNRTNLTTFGMGAPVFSKGGHRLHFDTHTSTDNRIEQWNLSTAWDLSTAVHDKNSVDLTELTSAAYPCQWKYDGTILYLRDSAILHSYTASTPWDIGSLTLRSSKTPSSTYVIHRFWKEDGLYITGSIDDQVDTTFSAPFQI